MYHNVPRFLENTFLSPSSSIILIPVNIGVNHQLFCRTFHKT
jgi:hypothetical protein